MSQELRQVIRTKSQINYSYMTIKMTPSRIDKGLIAIPVPLAKWFPKRNGTIAVYLDDSPDVQTKTFSSYESSTRECRIGGVAGWFRKNSISGGDEVVIQVIDKEDFVYRLIPEKRFIVETQRLQQCFDASESEPEASENFATLVRWTQFEKQEAVLSEFNRLVDTMPRRDREYARNRWSRARERVPESLRTLLEHIYKGHCQVCDFWFSKRDNRPYFETHHLNPIGGHHPKNVLVVCGNCHNQFEYTDVHHDLNMDGWLTRVSFNERTYAVNQVALNMKLEHSFKELFI